MTEKRVVIDYTNYRGERKLYEIEPLEIFFGSNEWHPDRQWIMSANVFRNDGKEVNNQQRTFTMRTIHQWFPGGNNG